jgi:hypothetical protein
MFLRPSRPEWRLKVQHLLYDVQRLPFARPGSRVSTREGSHSVIHSRRAGGPTDLCPWKVWSTWKSEDKSPPCTVPIINVASTSRKKKGNLQLTKRKCKISNVNITLATLLLYCSLIALRYILDEICHLHLDM